jgi:WhiB family redox-sensing transcriptional regulator
MRADTTPSAGAPEPPADPRPAWERIAYTWLTREVDGGQPQTAETLAAETSVTPAFARDLLRVLRAHRQRDPGLAELRARLVRDRLTDAYLRRELAGRERLDPAALAAELGTTATIARQWLHTLRAQHASEQGLGALGEPASRGEPSTAQLAGLAAHFAAGGHQRAAVAGRPVDAAQVAAEVERAYWTRQVRAGERLYALRLAREFGAEPHRIAQQLRELRAGPRTARERIEQLWQAHQADPGSRPHSSSQLAYRLGVSDAYVRHVTWQLRTRAGIAPLAERLAAAREQLTTPPAPGADGERDWRQDAACRDADPELFFPEPGQLPQTAKAKEVCAGCTVRGPCLDNALHGPLARDDRHGVFAGTTARDRTRLRGRPAMAQGTRFLTDRAAAEEALALANRVSLDRAARELGVSKPALRRAFDHHGLGQPQVFQGGPQRSRFLRDREAAEQAWRRAAEVGINQTRKELGTSDKALRTAWARHGLGLPPRPTTKPAPTPPLDPVFVTLNHGQLPTPRGARAEQAARLRRAEEIQTLGYRTVIALNGESRVAPMWRVAAVIRRAERAQTLARQRAGRSDRRRAERAERGRRPHYPKPLEEREVLADGR